MFKIDKKKLNPNFCRMDLDKVIKADPSGCPMCDSGKLRDPDKAHWDTCGYLLMEMVLTCAD